ncbi:MAG: trbL [Polaromonas sp.]|nr:trbL [Polaromonas sp.]
MKPARTRTFVTCCFALSLYSSDASAQLTNQGMLDQVVTAFATRAAAWETVVMNAAMWLFWTLGAISLVWTGGMMVLRKADIGQFFAELIRFMLFFGFFLWLLRNGPTFASSIIRSLQRIGEQASGVSSITPSGIVDVGFLIWKQAIANLSAWQPIDSFIGIVLSAGILILLAAIAVNMLLTLVSAWILMYAGIFFLGFGGSRWTSDIAINYYKSVLGVAAQLMAMVLLVGIGNDLLTTFYGKMSKGVLNFEELGVMLVFCMALLMLVAKVPSVLASVMSGVGMGSGTGNFGTGAVLGTAGAAAAAAGMAGAALSAGAMSLGGGAQALMAAYSKAAGSSSGASDGMGNMGGVAAAAAGLGSSNSGGGSVFASLDNATSGSGLSSSRGSGGGLGSGAAESASSGEKVNASTSQGKDSGSKEGADDQSKSDAGGKAAGSDAKGGGPGSSLAPGEQRATGSMLGRAASIAAGTAGNLALGTWDVAKAKASNMRESAFDRINDTTGAKIAAAIRAREAAERAPSSSAQADMAFNNNELSAGKGQAEPPDASEVADFVNRGAKTS